MARNKKMVSFALYPDLIKRMETWASKQEFPVSKTAILEVALREFLEKRNLPDDRSD